MTRLECAECGLSPVDLPDGVDPELVFVICDDQQVRCQGCAQ